MPLTQASLYELTQSFEIPAPSKLMTADSLQSLIKSLIDSLHERQLTSTIWFKTTNQGWIKEIKRYQQQGLVRKIYRCHDNSADSTTSVPLQAVSVELNEQLKEDFLLVLSSQFNGLIVAQSLGLAEQNDQSQIKMVCSFAPAVIENVFTTLKSAITEPTAENDDDKLDSTAIAAPDPDLLAELLLKQVQHNEVNRSLDIAPPADSSLVQSLWLKEEFLTNLLRELRPPLTNMKTALRLLESKQLKRDQRQRYLEMLHRECDRQNSLLIGLLEFVQLDADETVASVNLEELVPGVVSTYQPLAIEKGIMLGYTIPADLPPVACPAHWLRQIIINLLHNSLKFTDSQGRVYVQASSPKESVELTVSDTGVGIDSSELPQIFNIFYRGRAANSEDTGSAGLGLTMVQQLLDRCGGSISVTSKIGSGSTFKIMLPVTKTNAQSCE